MPDHRIKNRNNTEIAVNVLQGNGKSLAFIAHGLGGFKEQVHIKAMAQTFNDVGYTVVTYDAANTFGESGGNIKDATLTNYYEDLIDVISWTKEQDFFIPHFIVSGHSLGGACSLLYASQFPDEVKAIAPISAFIGGESFKKTQNTKTLAVWERTGHIPAENKSKPGVIEKLDWSFIEDAFTYDLEQDAKLITCPVLLVTGSKDIVTPAVAHKLIMAASQGETELHVIEDMEHNPTSDQDLSELSTIISDWLKKL